FSRDWSSDVCSSDLAGQSASRPVRALKIRIRAAADEATHALGAGHRAALTQPFAAGVAAVTVGAEAARALGVFRAAARRRAATEIGRAACRESAESA